jgi:hypothetical protein
MRLSCDKFSESKYMYGSSEKMFGVGRWQRCVRAWTLEAMVGLVARTNSLWMIGVSSCLSRACQRKSQAEGGMRGRSLSTLCCPIYAKQRRTVPNLQQPAGTHLVCLSPAPVA